MKSQITNCFTETQYYLCVSVVTLENYFRKGLCQQEWNRSHIETRESGSNQLAAKSNFKVIKDTHLHHLKRTVEVRLQDRVSEETLAEIADRIKATGKRNFDRTFIGYYLPSMEEGK